MEPSRYDQRGVSPDKNEVHQAIKKLDHGLFENTFCKIISNPFSEKADDCMILHADTAGTKTILAYLYWRETGDLSVWKGIAQDALVMNLDDMACSGATDKFVISNTILRNKKLIPGEVLQEIINGTIEFIDSMKKYGVSIHHAGGETADVGDVVRTVDVGYTALAHLNKSQVFENNIQPGDHILGIHSFGQSNYETEYNSGIGCNGLTSARHDVLDQSYADTYPESFDNAINKKLVYSGKYKMTDNYESHMIGKLLTSPTRTFLPFLKEMFTENMEGIHGIIHCTGGAHSKVIKFAKHVNIIKDNLPDPAPIFKIVQECSNTSNEEMYKVLNMGIRLELYGDPKALARAKAIASSLGLSNQFIGRVESSDTTMVTMRKADQEWIYA